MPDPAELDPTKDELEVECLNTGIYNTPIMQNKAWPNCTQTVLCGQPLPHPVDGKVNGTDGHDGSRTWLYGKAENTDTYNTWVEYRCARGSQFDTDGAGGGDSVTVKTRCQWTKAWSPVVPGGDSPPAALPPCLVTHCTAPYAIPTDTFLQEIPGSGVPGVSDSSSWTPVNQYKQYECQGKVGATHTRFWESDRTKSTFDILCLADGTYDFDNLRKSWPTCIEDIMCDKLPPDVPTSEEYTLPVYDGMVHVVSLDYPVVPVMNETDVVFNSSQTTNKLLPRNYLANLTYNCGRARNFMTESGGQVEMNMTCQWDKTWSPSNKLEKCDWVSCLKPPTPPASTHLRVTDWDGLPIPFGDKVHFVCERGLKFEEDPAQESVFYDCQDGTAPPTKKGFFDVPDKEEDWPRCLQAPLCPKPPDIPFEGFRDFVPNVLGMESVKSCVLGGETVELMCHTFLTVYVETASFGREAVNDRELCDGVKEKDRGSPGGDCLETVKTIDLARTLCHGKSSCSIPAEYGLANFTGCMPNDLKRELRTSHICGKLTCILISN